MPRLTKTLKEMTPLCSAYDLRFDGVTSKGHYRWLHVPSGRTLTTVRDMTSYHSLKNTERQIKRFVREVSEHGQHDRPH
jgi:hypothetical protein